MGHITVSDYIIHFTENERKQHMVIVWTDCFAPPNTTNIVKDVRGQRDTKSLGTFRLKNVFSHSLDASNKVRPSELTWCQHLLHVSL